MYYLSETEQQAPDDIKKRSLSVRPESNALSVPGIVPKQRSFSLRPESFLVPASLRQRSGSFRNDIDQPKKDPEERIYSIKTETEPGPGGTKPRISIYVHKPCEMFSCMLKLVYFHVLSCVGVFFSLFS